MGPDMLLDAGRRIAGLIGHSPGPGIYSRMERAVEAMPEMVRAEELPGLIRRHKEGVPGWELKATDLQGLVGDAAVIPRQDLLDRVQERSPVYTHQEVVLGGRPALGGLLYAGQRFNAPEYQGAPSRLGQGVSHGPSKYSDYGQGGDDYSELLLLQPNAQGEQFGSHWLESNASGARDAVAHARYDTHGDALRINELQSDLGIHNRKTREWDGQLGSPNAFVSEQAFPFPLEDAWADLLIKRLALEAARGGHRAIEVASPRQIADKVGGNIDNYEHFYGKVVPGAIERLGRKMGGLKRESSERLALPADPSEAVEAAIDAAVKDLPKPEMPDWAYQAARGRIRNAFNELAREYASNTWAPWNADIEGAAGFLHSRLRDAARQHGMPREAMDARMPQLMRAAEIAGADIIARLRPGPEPDDAIRYLMSDEMRRNILRNGIPASVLGAAALSNERQP